MTYFSQQIPALIFAAGLGAMTASTAFAQNTHGAMMHEGDQRHGKQMEQHHHQLHQRLKLTAEQQPAWQKLMDSEQPSRAAEAKPADHAKLTVPERAERRLARLKAELERQTNHLAALKTLYQVLTPEQKKVFEEFHSKQAHAMHRKSTHTSDHETAKTPTAKP
jgi:periplasmic protein CpxP/Spy